MTMVWVFFVAGLVLLVLGAEALVRGASRLAASLGVPPLVVGLTVVAYGTSTPEVAVSLQAALAGQADITIGNVVGSNIFNVLFILGLSAMIAPLVVSRKLVQIDVPLMVGVSVLMLVVALDGRISRLDGALLAALLLIYTAFLVRQAKKERAEARERDFVPARVAFASLVSRPNHVPPGDAYDVSGKRRCLAAELTAAMLAPSCSRSVTSVAKPALASSTP